MDTAGEEAMERLMEIAQQQQMLLNRDHNIILGLGSENIGDGLTNANHREDEVLGHRDADDVPLPEISHTLTTDAVVEPAISKDFSDTNINRG